VRWPLRDPVAWRMLSGTRRRGDADRCLGLL